MFFPHVPEVLEQKKSASFVSSRSGVTEGATQHMVQSMVSIGVGAAHSDAAAADEHTDAGGDLIIMLVFIL